MHAGDVALEVLGGSLADGHAGRDGVRDFGDLGDDAGDLSDDLVRLLDGVDIDGVGDDGHGRGLTDRSQAPGCDWNGLGLGDGAGLDVGRWHWEENQQPRQ